MAGSLAFLDWTFHSWPEILDRATQLIQEVTVTSDLTIAEQVAEHHGASAGRLTADVAEAFAAEQRDLAVAGLPSVAAGAGDRMPDGNLLDVAGQPTSLAEALGSRPGVIVFYRGGWCPYCDIALRTYQAQLVPALADRGIPLVAVSPQTPDGSLSTKETKELTFTVLSDPGNQIAGQLGILTAPSDGARAAQLQLGLDLTKVNADGTTALPMPTVIVVDASGVIRWIDVHRDYTSRTEPDQVLQAITQTIG
ncbi:MAG: peroxiredoxin-like family protein [Streptosporangiaceae bacterium]